VGNGLAFSSNASGLEIFWTGFALLIEILAVHSMFRALSGVIILRCVRKVSWIDELMVLAIKRLRGTLRVCWFEMVFILIGVVSMRTPPRTNDNGIDADLATYIVFFCFISLEVIDFCFLIWDEIDWNYIATRLLKASRIESHSHTTEWSDAPEKGESDDPR
jgi:hypothetical protein